MFTIQRSKRLKLPMLYVMGKTAQPWNLKYINYLKRILEFNKLVDHTEGDNVYLKDGWKFKIESAEIMAREFPEWRFYLPSFSLEGKTVLDIGAGCGETARYFLKAGAKNVVCVEPEIKLIEVLFDNMMRFPILPVMEKFYVKQLSNYPHDFLKLDIEGYEAILLNALEDGELEASDLKPTILEAHSEYCINEFRNKGFRILKQWRSDLAVMSNEVIK